MRPASSISHSLVGPFTAGCDFVVLVVLGAVSGSLFDLLAGSVHRGRASYIGLGCVVAGLTVALLKSRNLYDRSFVLGDHVVVPIVKTWFVVFSLLAIASFLLGTQPEFSRGALVTYFATGGIALIGIRRCARGVLLRAIRSGSLASRRVILIGDSREVSVSEFSDALRGHGYRLVKSVLLNCAGSDQDAVTRVTEANLASVVRTSEVDEILLALRWSDIACVEAIMAELRVVPVPVRLLPDMAASRFVARPTTDIGIARTVDLQRAALRKWEIGVKAVVDFILAAFGLILFAPLFAAVALLIRLDSPGPVFFRQSRVGYNGRQFRIYKFRTMTTLDDGADVRQATRNDTRVTRIGQWLRSSSVDELPQLFNVLLGEMSLVGPRPHAVAHDSEFGGAISHYALRHQVKPGITGWAQVCGFRGETPTFDLVTKRVEHDLWYIQNWSFWLDAFILVRTAVTLMNPKNVY